MEFLTHVWILKEHFNHIESSPEPWTRPQKKEAKVSPGSESGGSTTGSESESGYGQGSGNGCSSVRCVC